MRRERKSDILDGIAGALRLRHERESVIARALSPRPLSKIITARQEVLDKVLVPALQDKVEKSG